MTRRLRGPEQIGSMPPEISGVRRTRGGTSGPDPGILQELLMDAILDVRGWSAVLRHLSGLLSARQAVLEVHPSDWKDHPPFILSGWGIREQFRRKYLSTFAVRNPWMILGHSRFRAGAVLPGQRILGLRELVKTEFYTEFLRPQNVLHLVGVVLADDENGLTTLVFLRSPEAGPFDRTETSVLRKSVPALQKALQTHFRFRGSLDRSWTVQGILDHLQIGIVTLDGRGRTASMNRRAREILAAREALGLSSGRLKCMHPGDARAFAFCLKKSLRGGKTERAAEILSVRRVGAGPPLFLVIFAIRGGGSRLESSQPRALAILMDPRKKEYFSVPILVHLFGLSPAEARLACLLGSGLSLAEIARRLGIRINTARTHLKHVFAKTRTSRQGELVHLLLRSAAVCIRPQRRRASDINLTRPI